MRTFIVMVIMIATRLHADVVSSNTAGHTVAFTNMQSNYSWTPKAVGIIYPALVTGAVTITRYGQGAALVLASNSFQAASVIWSPLAEYHIATYSSLVVSSSVQGFIVQLHRGPTP